MQNRKWFAAVVIAVSACLGGITASAFQEAPAGNAGPAAGLLPPGADGRPLNLDFETGTLQDWTATGAAFDRQPIKGDTVSPRRNDMRSQHHGNYWIGSYEILGDGPQGTLTSKSFKVTQ